VWAASQPGGGAPLPEQLRSEARLTESGARWSLDVTVAGKSRSKKNMKVDETG